MKNDGIYNDIAGLVEKAKQAMEKEELLIEINSLRKIQRLVEEGLANLEGPKEHEMKKTDERKSQITLALVRIQLRQKVSLRDITNLKRDVGFLVKEPEMVAINMKAEELLNFLKNLLQDIFEKQMKVI